MKYYSVIYMKLEDAMASQKGIIAQPVTTKLYALVERGNVQSTSNTGN
jgi:hypothetical protein